MGKSHIRAASTRRACRIKQIAVLKPAGQGIIERDADAFLPTRMDRASVDTAVERRVVVRCEIVRSCPVFPAADGEVLLVVGDVCLFGGTGVVDGCEARDRGMCRVALVRPGSAVHAVFEIAIGVACDHVWVPGDSHAEGMHLRAHVHTFFERVGVGAPVAVLAGAIPVAPRTPPVSIAGQVEIAQNLKFQIARCVLI